ncbi:MAG: nitroreductase family protein, partial [Promethearchaeota archaeon]
MEEKTQKNQILESLNNRRTIRAYHPKTLSQDEIDTIIQGAMRAPTAGNLMMYSIIQVADKNLKE